MPKLKENELSNNIGKYTLLSKQVKYTVLFRF